MTRIALPLVAATLAATVGCTSATTGNEGNFQFSYAADDRALDFNKPIAVGARLDLQVRDVGARLPVALSEASVDDPAVADVVDFASHRLTVEATGEGGALLQVAGTTLSGEALTDSVNLLARVPEVLELSHTCTAEREAAYLTDQRIYVPFELEMANRQPVIGYGYYPVEVVDEVARLNQADSGQQFMAFDTAPEAGLLTLASEIDDTVLDARIVTPAQIDGVVEPVAFVWEDIDVGDRNAFHVLPSTGGLPICQAAVQKTVRSDTPEICAVRDRLTPDPDSKELGWFEVEGLSAGTCTYTVTYPAASGGEGTSRQFQFPIEP